MKIPLKMRFFTLVVLSLLTAGRAVADRAYEVAPNHPRIFITQADLPGIAARCAGPLSDAYAAIKRQADAAVRSGRIRFLDNKWAVPTDLMACGLAYLVERESGRPSRPYAEVIIKAWGDGRMLTDRQNCAFGYHAIAYDWIFDALDDTQKKLYGDALGSWFRWYTGRADITLKGGNWWYNQTWGPNHLNVMQSRDALTQKLLIALAIYGEDTAHAADARTFLDSWAARVPAECIPAFDEMGGSWAESHGHGAYGPIQVIPYAFAAWQSATGQNLFNLGQPWGYLKEMSTWLTYLLVPHVGRHAYIDDGGGGRDAGFGRSAPFVAGALRDPLAQGFAVQAEAERRPAHTPWQRVVAYDPELAARSPADLGMPLAYLLKGAGHAFMHSGWDDPNATWAFFGAGPHRVGHQHDDEGHFLISSRGGLVGKAGGQGSNDNDHYWGGSLVFNILTIFDPEETFRRSRNNENDGGLLRHVYDDRYRERGHIVAYRHTTDFTYAAADLTLGYNRNKAREVTRQFIYLRGQPGVDEFFVVFDRVHGTRAEFAKHFMLHVPEEPMLSGAATVQVPGHVVTYAGSHLEATWPSLPGDFGPSVEVLSTGRSRMFMRTLLPEGASVTKRGGEGHTNWGHPLEPTAQYVHGGAKRDAPPICRWRLEVAAPLTEHTLFLHVFQVAHESAEAMLPVSLLESDGNVRVLIGPESRRWQVDLAPDGPLSASIAPPGAAPVGPIGDDIDVQGQYLHDRLPAVGAARDRTRQ